jgi:transcriptional regulator with XRE-family HTH domain
MLATVISKIERGERRIDVDDLVAFALALNVSPLTLLLPPTADGEPVDLTESYTLAASTAWSWAEGRQTAMDWDARPIASFDPSADPAISSELYEQEQEFGRRNAEYVALAQPPARRRQADHPAMRMLQLLSSLVADLVTPSLNLDRVHLSALSRMARRRYDQLGYELEDIAEKLPPVHPGVPQDQNGGSTTEDGGASVK